MAQVFTKHNDPESETAKFLTALGELRIYFAPLEVLCKLMLLCGQATSRTGGLALVGMICVLLHTSQGAIIAPTSTDSLQQSTISSLPS